MHFANTADSIDIPFGAVGQVGQRKHVLDGGSDSHEKKNFGGMGQRNVTYRENAVPWREYTAMIGLVCCGLEMASTRSGRVHSLPREVATRPVLTAPSSPSCHVSIRTFVCA